MVNWSNDFFFVLAEKGIFYGNRKKIAWQSSTWFDFHELLLFPSRFGLSFLVLTTIATVSRPYNAAINAYQLHLCVSIAYEGIFVRKRVQERRLSYVGCVSSMLVKKNYRVTCGVAIDFTSNNDHSFYWEYLFPLMAVFSRRPLVYADCMYETMI